MKEFGVCFAFVSERVNPKKVGVFIQEEDIILYTADALNWRSPEIRMNKLKRRRDIRL